jgi:hypothetical protein
MNTSPLFLLSITLVVTIVLSILTTIKVNAQSTPAPSTTAAPRAVTVNCDRTSACYPWSAQGPACSRGSRMNLRFTGTAAPENGVNVSGVAGNVTEMTYAFCPIVDELQAFNLTNFTRLAAVYSEDNGATWKEGTVSKSYISAIGFGNQTSRTLPPLSSEGKVLILDATSNSPCNAPSGTGGAVGSGSGAGTGSIGFVNFLVLNVTLVNGKFIYVAGQENPPGNGFAYTCNSNDLCSIDSEQRCFGDTAGKKMCGKCYDAATLSSQTMQIWVSYYGTDVNGRTLRSGASNPLNFLKYSLVNVYSSINNAYSNIKNAQLTRPDLQTDNGF